MYILGISCYYHDSAASLIKDGKVVVAAEEERFTRKKHDNSFPLNAINFCLQSQGITIKNVSSIAFYEKPLLKFERVLYSMLETFPKSFKIFVTALPSWINEKLRLKKTLKKKLKYKGDIYFISHHVSHAASSFLISLFKSAAIVTVDGVGEWATTTYGQGQDNEITLTKEIKFPHSLGLFYSTLTAYLGFEVNDGEYKVMGLSAYGNLNKDTNQYYKKLKQVIDIKDDGSFRLDMSYFSYHYSNKMPSSKLINLLGDEIRIPNSEITKRHKDVAAALQMVYEEVFFKILNHVQEITKQENLVLSGGAIQNSVANGKILKKTDFKNVWISPNVTDGGASMGAALYLYHSILDHPRTEVLQTSYLGPSFSSVDTKQFLDKTGIEYQKFENTQALTKHVAQLIYDNNIIGWFQGAMEFGPRALGHRSILANPTNSKIKEILNQKIKHREEFRPFASVVSKDDASKYFKIDIPLPESTDFMTMVYPVKENAQHQIPAVTHVDGTGRLQTISKQQNYLLYNLIKQFENLSGVPVLVNTSFNMAGEPMVANLQDAYDCMVKAGIDYLVMDNFLIKGSNSF